MLLGTCAGFDAAGRKCTRSIAWLGQMHMVVDGSVECAAAAAERVCVVSCGWFLLTRLRACAMYGMFLCGGLVLVLTLQTVSAFDRSRGLARCIWL